MRFFSDGPRIPDELLEERDNGNVVFFCGAGVSRPTFPGFVGLANQVMEKLGTPRGSKGRALLERAEEDPEFGPTLDLVFKWLQHEYGAGTIDDEVSQLLKTPPSADTEKHSIVLRLSKNAGGSPQIVTTNFDLLFERAKKTLKRHVPPALPDLASGQPLEGLVYLHGRRAALRTAGTVRQGLIISSSDFGRAYLADGWATRFVRELLKNYVIVLLGYSASDPPIHYLLEGLHSRDDHPESRIFAFDSGTEEQVHEKWSGRGVRALAYQKTDAGHSALWHTLRAWADRADDPDNWRRSVIDLARKGPRGLAAYERGQVASLVRTAIGAKLFADSDPPPPAEWLCVFDVAVRFGKPERRIGQNDELDPLSVYGLDDDPRRPIETGPISGPMGDDLLSPNSVNERIDRHRRLAGVGGRWANPLPPRLFHLARWIGTVASEPTTVWWVSGYPMLHSNLLDQIEMRLERPTEDLHETAVHSWSLLLEKFRGSSDADHDRAWYEFVDKLKKSGWTSRTLREFERVTQPDVIFKRPLSMNSTPPQGSWRDLAIQNIVEFEVRFPAHELENLNITSEVLQEVFRILRRGLERGGQILRDIETRYWHTATFHPEDLPGSRHLSDGERYFHFVAALLDRLESDHPEFVRKELAIWPKHDEFFFDKLKIYAWMKAKLFTGEEAASGLLGLSQEGFCNSYHRRELLHTLKARWADFSPAERAQIEGRIIAGPAQWEKEQDTDYELQKSVTSATILGWLQREGCELSADSLTRLPQLRAANARWSSSWDERADMSYDGRAGWVSTEPDPVKILDVPVSQLVKIAEEHTTRRPGEFKEYLPFRGLVEQRPFRAVAALSYEARQERFPVEFWRTALSHWPQESSDRLKWLFACRVSQLPREVLVELRYYVPDWLHDHLSTLASSSLEGALNIWDEVIQKLLQAGAKATQSSLGETFVGGAPLNLSRRTYDHAINSPIGKMSKTLFNIMDVLQLDKDAKIPKRFRSRLEQLFDAPGEGSDHAISETTLRLRWLYYLDPKWVQNQILPMFALDQDRAEPAWNGYLHDNRLPAPELFQLLKPQFLKLVECVSRWRWGNGAARRLQEFLVIACYFNVNDSRYVSYEEARSALQKSDDQGRAHALWFLTSIVRDNRAWNSFGKPFVQLAWPREKQFQSESTSRQFAMMAEESGNHFPDVVGTILPLLMPVKHLHLLIYRTTKTQDKDETPFPAKFPEPMLALLDRLVPKDFEVAPYELNSVLTMIAEAKPRLRQDPRWRRLHDVVNKG
jgi:SIR2-like domain